MPNPSDPNPVATAAMTSPASASSAASVRQRLLARAEIALVDVRPEGLFAEGHPLFAASLPLGRLEAEVLDRLRGRGGRRPAAARAWP